MNHQTAASSRAKITLKPGRDKAIRQGHPWLFSGAISRTDHDSPSSSPALAEVHSARGEVLGLGFFNPKSQIRVRMLPGTSGPSQTTGASVNSAINSVIKATIDRDYFGQRLDEAARLRAALVPEETTGLRLLNAEGDGVPGWTIDRFGEVLVSQMTCAGLDSLRSEAYAALSKRYPETSILHLGDLPPRRQEGLSTEDEWIIGSPQGESWFEESGLRVWAEIGGGQKTGFYCDQRENRRRVEGLSGGRSVLDLFAHTGGFGLYADRGGAHRVVHVESAARLIDKGRQVYAANERADAAVDWVEANVFEYLRGSTGETRSFDLVVCDPPPLVRRRRDLDRGARAYKDLNRLALSRLAPGGLFLTFSCSGAVDAKLFRQILFAAATEAGVRLSLLAPLAAGADHPVAVTHPEGEYLKGWLAVVV